MGSEGVGEGPGWDAPHNHDQVRWGDDRNEKYVPKHPIVKNLVNVADTVAYANSVSQGDNREIDKWRETIEHILLYAIEGMKKILKDCESTGGAGKATADARQEIGILRDALAKTEAAQQEATSAWQDDMFKFWKKKQSKDPSGSGGQKTVGGRRTRRYRKRGGRGRKCTRGGRNRRRRR